MKSKSVIILFSGGYDSTFLVNLAWKIKLVPFCILFDYGQKHIKELEVAEQFCSDEGLRYEVIKLNIGVQSKLTQGDQRYEGVSEWHVPSRNLIFLAHAASLAEGNDFDLIWYGANYADRDHLFPDCYQEWVYRLNKLLEINGSSVIKVEAPLLGMTKETIVSLGENLFNLKIEQTYSGYGKAE